MNGLQVNTSKEQGLQINAKFERYPIVYGDYETGEIRYLSKREKVLVDVWLKTGGNIGECSRQLLEIGWRGGKARKETIARYLKRAHITAHLTEKIKEKALAMGYDENRWISEGIKFKEGKLRDYGMSFHFWKELGRALGYYREPESPAMQMNQQINFVQADGNE